ncbi:MAG: rod shape-determining protein RodA [Candidatus Saganbacteria bacterium]|nr:rod shape-determining protein RodA [Candidatus Saganbacteria bacterium]
MINPRMFKISDSLIWIIPIVLVLIGLLLITSTTYNAELKGDRDPFSYVKRQAVSCIIGLAGMVYFAFVDYKKLRSIAPFLYILMLIMLVLVLFMGRATAGAQRWLMLGPLSFQPSEVAKLLLIISLAAYFNSRKDKIGMFRALVIAGIPFLLIFKQPDLGTGLVLIAISLGMLIWGKASPVLLTMIFSPLASIYFSQNLYLWITYIILLWGVLYFSRVKLMDMFFILGINIGVGVALPILWGLLKPYQQMRILSFLNPTADPHGIGYHTLQSKIAVGAGGLFGSGFMQGTQTQLQFVPIQNSDFIFSAIAEEFGFIGSTTVVALFTILLWRIFSIAENAYDYFGSMLVAGIGVMMFFHFIVSVGMNIGVLPVVGIPLPFVSFGGTSLVENLVAIGIIQSVAMRRQKLIF